VHQGCAAGNSQGKGRGGGNTEGGPHIWEVLQVRAFWGRCGWEEGGMNKQERIRCKGAAPRGCLAAAGALGSLPAAGEDQEGKGGDVTRAAGKRTVYGE
jgi:hypothetical protein